jgi:hypothetical protein
MLVKIMSAARRPMMRGVKGSGKAVAAVDVICSCEYICVYMCACVCVCMCVCVCVCVLKVNACIVKFV